MINAIIEFSARNKIIVFILIGAAVMGGLAPRMKSRAEVPVP